jgi:hypothetical protein
MPDDDNGGLGRYYPSSSGDWRPIPDPTKLTTDAVNAATQTFRRDMGALRELIETRLDSMDKATELLAATVGRVPSDTDKSIGALRELLSARIDGMDIATKLLADYVDRVPTDIDKSSGVLRQELDRRIISLSQVLGARMDGMDIATRLVADSLDRVLQESSKTIESQKDVLLAELHSAEATAQERYSSIDSTFNFNKAALDVALTAQKESSADQVRAIAASLQATRESLQGEIRSVLDVSQEKFTAIENALAGEIRAVQGVADQKFQAVEGTFASNALALTAALAAQKEAASLSADTLTLCADLTWRPAGDLLPGDELIAFDEESPGQSGRCYRRAVVTANVLKREPLLRVNTAAGSVRCTYNHPWLVRRYRGHAWEWRLAENLRPGDVLVKPLDVWDVNRSYEAGWFAGILDGEGCLGFKSRRNGAGKLSIGQVDGLVADLIDKALKESGVVVLRHTRPAQAYSRGSMTGHAQEQRRWEINRRADIMRILGTYRPARMSINSDQVWEGFAIKSTTPDDSRLILIESIEGAGTGMVAHLATSTHTYIGAGFAMHNSEQNKSNTLAINKSEQATKEASLANVAQTTSSLASQAATIADLKERLVRLESGGGAFRDARDEERAIVGASLAGRTLTSTNEHYQEAQSRARISMMIAAASALIALIAIIVTVILHK